MEAQSPRHLAGLRQTIISVVGGEETPRQLNSLITLSHSVAEAFLRSKRSPWALMELHGMSSSDLAFDCIAELFRRDETGHLIEIKTYYEGFAIEESDDEETFAYLRRLVFSKVNNHLYALMRESDTALGKILRNLKISVRSMKHFREEERFGEPYICPVDCDALEELPAFQRNDLEQICFEHILDVTNIPQLMAKLSLALRRQSEFSRLIPLFQLATVIRDVMGKQLPSANVPVTFTTSFNEQDTLHSIKKACNTARTKFTATYVDKGKLSCEVLGTYLAAIEAYLTLKVVGKDGSRSSLFGMLVERIPGLSEKEYIALHKSKLEYIAHFVYAELRKELQN